MTLLDVRGLSVEFDGVEGRSIGVHDISFSVGRGRILGLVGETGAGKTVTTRAILGTVRGGHISADGIDFAGVDLLRAPPAHLRLIRGRRIGLVVQDARSALPPAQSVGDSVRLILRTHTAIGRREARQRVLRMFETVGLPDPEAVYRRLPHELSGGMAQRVIIGAAMITDPELVIADEATTALDLTVQAQVLDLLREQIRERHAAAIIVTHDLGIVAQYCTDVAVLYAGRLREFGPVDEVLSRPAHPYTLNLLRSVRRFSGGRVPELITPRPEDGCEYRSVCPHAERECELPDLPLQDSGARRSLCRLPLPTPEHATLGDIADAAHDAEAPARAEVDHHDSEVVLRISELTKRFAVRGAALHAVNGVNLEVGRGQTVAVVGESGAGKTTLGRCTLRLVDHTSGTIEFAGIDIGALKRRAFRPWRSDIQVVYQDPTSSLDPRLRAHEVVGEPLAVFAGQLSRTERKARVLELMADVGLPERLCDRYPHQLSGGQQQRLAIARALATDPRLVVLDEPTASLDASVQGQVLELLRNLQDEHGLAYLLISHDLSSVRHMADQLIVMYLGEIVEQGPSEEVFQRPVHPYTQALLSAALSPDPRERHEKIPLEGEIPRPTNLPDGCYFASRCPIRISDCTADHPPLTQTGPGHHTRCIRTGEPTAELVRAATAAPDLNPAGARAPQQGWADDDS